MTNALTALVKMTGRLGWAAVMLAAVVPAGCVEWDGDGQGAYTLRNHYRTEVSSVYVPIWTRGKDVYRRELEYRLTEAIIKRIEMDTPYTITDRPRADSELTGQLLLVEQGVLGRNPDSGDVLEQEIEMVIAFAWRNLQTGEVMAEEVALQVRGTYIPECPLGEDFFQGSQDVIEKAARLVVEHMEAEWGKEPVDSPAADENL